MDFDQEPFHEDPGAPLPHKNEREDFQPVSSAGRTLGLFFAIVLIAALCLAVGYHLGNRSAGSSAATPAATESTPLSNAPKPSAAVAANAQPAPADGAATTAPSGVPGSSSSSDLSATTTAQQAVMPSAPSAQAVERVQTAATQPPPEI